MTSTSTPCHRCRSTSRKSRTAAPVGLVITARRRGKPRQRLLVLWIEESFGRQFLLQLAQRLLQRTESARLNLANHQLITAPRRIDIDVTATDDLQAVLQIESQATGHTAPDHRADLGIRILECQIQMPGLRTRQVGHFADDPHGRKALPPACP